MKKTYKVYKPGTKVYAIAKVTLKEKETDYCSIYEAKVDSIFINYNSKTNSEEIEYWVHTPDGKEWGDSVPESDVHIDFNILANRMKKIWKAKSNSHD